MPEPGQGEGPVVPQPDQEQAPKTASGESYDVVANRINPLKTIPQFKMLAIDPLGEIVSGKGTEPKDNGGDEAKPKTWPDGNPVVDRQVSTEPDVKDDGMPSNQVSDIDKARSMADAGNSKNMEAAYLRRAASIKESDLPLGEVNKQLEKLKDDYKHDAQENLVREYNPKYLREFAEEPDDEAERLEFWAGEIHDHPDLAGELTPQNCVNIEKWIADNANHPKQIDRQIDELKARDEDGKLPLREVVQIFHDTFDNSGKLDAQRRFNELTSNNATTVGEIKRFLYDELHKKADGWRKGLDASRNRLAAIQGK